MDLKDTWKCINKDSYKRLAMKPNNIQKLTYYLVPCDNLPWGPYEVGAECIADAEKQREYVN